MTPPGLIFYALGILLCSAAVTALVLRHLRIIDTPNERSSHSTPTPRGGGLGIVISFALALLLIPAYAPEIAAPLAQPPFVALLAALLLIAAISLHDDISGRGFASKLIIQLIAAGTVLACGLVIDLTLFGLPTGMLTSVLAWPLTLFWLVGLTNAYNFMDGLDGMAGTTAAIAAAFFSLICAQHGLHFMALIALALSAGACGFLWFNWPPAKIFMGDVGSTFLGFAFAALAVLASQEAQQTDRLPLLLSMPLLLLHYLFDTVYTFCRRLRAGENVFTAHRSHLYQLLNRSGLSHRQVTLIYAGMACLQGLAATWMSTAPSAEFTSRLWLFAPLLAGHGVFTFWVIRRSRRLKLI